MSKGESADTGVLRSGESGGVGEETMEGMGDMELLVFTDIISNLVDRRHHHGIFIEDLSLVHSADGLRLLVYCKRGMTICFHQNILRLKTSPRSTGNFG